MISIQKGLSKDEGVSPVIGVILLVAITVILAAVIAAFVFGYAGSMGKTKVVSVTFERTGTGTADVMFTGGIDTRLLDTLRATTDSTLGSCGTDLTRVGDYVPVGGRITCSGLTQEDHVTVIGFFNDDTQQVLLDTKF